MCLNLCMVSNLLHKAPCPQIELLHSSHPMNVRSADIWSGTAHSKEFRTVEKSKDGDASPAIIPFRLQQDQSALDKTKDGSIPRSTNYFARAFPKDVQHFY